MILLFLLPFSQQMFDIVGMKAHVLQIMFTMALFHSCVPESDDSEAPFTLVIFKCLVDKTLLFTCSHIVCLLYPQDTNLIASVFFPEQHANHGHPRSTAEGDDGPEKVCLLIKIPISCFHKLASSCQLYPHCTDTENYHPLRHPLCPNQA